MHQKVVTTADGRRSRFGTSINWPFLTSRLSSSTDAQCRMTNCRILVAFANRKPTRPNCGTRGYSWMIKSSSYSRFRFPGTDVFLRARSNRVGCSTSGTPLIHAHMQVATKWLCITSAVWCRSVSSHFGTASCSLRGKLVPMHVQL